MPKELKVETNRGVLLDGVLFDASSGSDTVVIAITGIHGNFYSNPFYVNFGETLNAGGIDFVYAQTSGAPGRARPSATTPPARWPRASLGLGSSSLFSFARAQSQVELLALDYYLHLA